MNNSLQAYRVRSCISLQGEKAASGKMLFSPLPSIDNCLILTKNGYIVFIGAYSPKSLPAGISHVVDFGERVLVPCAFNAHTHVQLAHSKGATVWGKGFVPWLRSLISLLPLPLDVTGIDDTVRDMKNSGTVLFADYTNVGLPLVAHSCEQHEIEAIHFAEWFGFSEQWDDRSALPQRVRDVIIEGARASICKQNIIPCAHALYSTAPAVLQNVKKWCNSRAKPFTLHLAEFPEEVEALTTGMGALVELYDGIVLPQNWKAPGLAPVEYAQSLGLLDKRTLAVHCVMCDESDIRILSDAKASVCLCPRSNANLAVGTAPIWQLANSSINLCLGTDGLSSNIDLNVWNEALYLHEMFEFPWEALLRMLTVNAAAIFGSSLGTLGLGARANWTFLPSGKH